MQREIKFRAWDKVLKTWLSDLSDAADPVRKGNFTSQLRPTKNVMLLQFTGLKDNNGKEIYEGDVVRVSYDGALDWLENGDDEVGVVEWGMQGPDEYYPAFDLKGHDMEVNALSTAKNNGDIEVVGNIHENPELLNS